MTTATSRAVEFSCRAPYAKAVFVAGTFNDWKPDAAPLHHHQSNGKWTTTLPLRPGHHEYKFVVDGRWCCEPDWEHAHQGGPNCVSNPFGTMNCALEVP